MFAKLRLKKYAFMSLLGCAVLGMILLTAMLLSACSAQPAIPTQTELPPETPMAPPPPSATPSATVLPGQLPAALVETHAGVSIALTWVYADSARIGLEYHIQGLQIPDGYHLYCPVSAVSLQNDEGKEYEKYIWPPAEKPSENFEIGCKQTEAGNEYIVTQNYYGVTAGRSQPLGLSLSIALGGFKIYNQNSEMQMFPAQGPFVFHFNVPILGSLTLDPNLTQSKNGMTVSLKRLVISPSLTDAYLCISYDNHKGWYPELTLTSEEKIYQPDETATTRVGVDTQTAPTFISQFTTERCYRYSFFASYRINSASPRQMLISLNKMTINAMDALSQEDCSANRKELQRSYPDLGFSCNIDTSNPQGLSAGINIDRLPSGMDRLTAYQIVEDGFKSIVEGPFVFMVNAP